MYSGTDGKATQELTDSIRSSRSTRVDAGVPIVKWNYDLVLRR